MHSHAEFTDGTVYTKTKALASYCVASCKPTIYSCVWRSIGGFKWKREAQLLLRQLALRRSVILVDRLTQL